MSLLQLVVVATALLVLSALAWHGGHLLAMFAWGATAHGLLMLWCSSGSDIEEDTDLGHD